MLGYENSSIDPSNTFAENNVAVAFVENEETNLESTDDVHFNPESHSTIRVIILVFALSLHSVFEGFSVGMVEDVKLLLQVYNYSLKN